MLRDSRNEEFQDRIYYALANIENKRGNEEGAAGLYWKSVHASVDNDNQQALSFVKLGDYYFKNKAYVQAQIDRGEKKIYLPMYPAYTGVYIRGSTPKDGSVWEERYKMFYHIDPDIDLVTVGPNTPQAKAVLAQEQ